MGWPLTSAKAQDAAKYQVPAKDVVVLVDVSGSMAKPGSGGTPIDEVGEARKIISEIVEGTRRPKLSGWKQVGKSTDTVINEGFAGYLSQDFKEPLPALIKPGNAVGVKLAGNFNTVITNTLQAGKSDYTARRSIPREKKMGKQDSFTRVLEQSWPDRFQDQTTCYTFALALAARGMEDVSGGYYIFTVSDEDDEPTWEPGSDKTGVINDRKMWQARYEKINWSVSQIKTAIDEGMVTLAGGSQEEWKEIQRKQLIARFEKTLKGDGPDKKIKINWYFGGEKPTLILKAEKAVLPEKEPESIPPDWSFRLLGTAMEGEGVNVFNYGNAMLVYQIDGLIGKPPTVTATIDFEGKQIVKVVPVVTKTQRAPGGAPAATFALGDLFAPASKDERLKYGDVYTLKLSADGVPERTFTFKVNKPSPHWLYWLGAVSAALALGIFIYSWRTLRGADQVN